MADEASKKVNVYTLGEHGINRVKSPVHVLDGELLNATNGTVRPVQGQLALTKRDGMVVINEDVAAGTLVSITNIPIESFGGGPELCVPIPDRDWQGGCYSPELQLLCIVGADGTGDRVATSDDGIEWTLRTTPAVDRFWREVIWSTEKALFVAVGLDGCMTSPDGITWTARTVPARSWRSVGYSADLDLFVAVGSACVMTSPDAITWTDRTTPGTNFTPLNFITGFSGRKVLWVSELSKWVVVGAVQSSFTQLMTSLDGINWSRGTMPTETNWVDMAWSPTLELLVATGIADIGSIDPKKAYSANGTSWTIGNFDQDFDGFGVDWAPEIEMFYAAYGTDFGAEGAAYSTDGINWINTAPHCIALGTCKDVIWFPPAEVFVILGTDMVELIGLG